MRSNRAGPARGFSWQTSPQARNRGRRDGFAREPDRACRKTSGKCGRAAGATNGAIPRGDAEDAAAAGPSAGCVRSGGAPQCGIRSPPAPGESRRRGTSPARHARTSAGLESPRMSPSRTTMSVMPLDHPRWADREHRVVRPAHCRCIGSRPAHVNRPTRDSRHPSPSTVPRFSVRPSDASGRASRWFAACASTIASRQCLFCGGSC